MIRCLFLGAWISSGSMPSSLAIASNSAVVGMRWVDWLNSVTRWM
ncbi:hypothetical protein NON20_13430 [Synechocystis sp. B12]|nr:hypothetical protein NON20_13430 [Synechocystis sp. B12]